jgi:hypothetical protein
MSPEEEQRKTERVDQNVMSDTRPAPRAARTTVERGRAPGSRKEDWIAHQLKRVYDDALDEAIPREMLDLLNQLDESVEDPEPEGGERA